MVPFSFAGHDLCALPEAALYWPARRALIVADLHFEKASWFARWGRWSLLLSWLPGGDLLVFLAGTLRMPILPFVILITLAKTGRYVVLAFATQAAL